MAAAQAQAWSIAGSLVPTYTGLRKIHKQNVAGFHRGEVHRRTAFAASIAAELGDRSVPNRLKAEAASSANASAADLWSDWNVAPRISPLFHTWLVQSKIGGLALRCRLVSCPQTERDTTGRRLQAGPEQSLVSLSSLDTSSEAATIRPEEWIATIRDMFRNMGDGQISISAYDTAWVALVPALDKSGKPQFPRSLDWIMQNQFADGSWGEPDLFSAYDRVVNTVACVVALRTWGIGDDNVTRGCDFITQNLHRIADEPEDHMPIGFEIVFPAMMDDARNLGLDLPYDSPTTHKILVERDRKLKKIPMEILHTYPTTLLHSLEGLRHLVDWDRLLKLQSKDGSFLCSPASTACALMHTGDQKCLQYLNSVLEQFDNAVPNVYPVDMFEHMWIVDRLQRLGIARHFQKEIRTCLDYVYQNWESRGVAWARDAVVTDVDDTAMGFRLLRLHGYDVSPEVFLPFNKDDEFFCFAGQSGQAVTGMFNLYRASQTLFPGEGLLRKARAFTRSFLEEKWRTNDISDKWIITKDLPGEVEYALKYPFYASLPRLETRAYLEHYGSDDIWIGKSLYKMPYVHNPTFLDLAKADYNMCQQQHREEVEELVRWNEELNLGELSVSRQELEDCFFTAAANMYEPELSMARKVWTQSGVLTAALTNYFQAEGISIQDLRQFRAAVARWNPALIQSRDKRQATAFMGLYKTINAISAQAYVAQGRDISKHLIGTYKRWIDSCLVKLEWAQQDMIPEWEEYLEKAGPSNSLECFMLPPMFFMGEPLSENMLEEEEFTRLRQRVNIIGLLSKDLADSQAEPNSPHPAQSLVIHMTAHPEETQEEAVAHLRDIIDTSMQELTCSYALLQRPQLPQTHKKLFFYMARVMHLLYLAEHGHGRTVIREYAHRLLFQPVC